MILRKPYAFLIKFFKLIHLIITGLLIYLAYCNREVYKYLKLCISDIVNKYDALQHINYSIYIFIILAVGLFFTIYYLLKYKDKPKNVYIISIVGYIVIGIFMFFTFNYFTTFSMDVLDQKTLRLYKDIMSITLVFQYAMIILMLIRGMGFDIKKFNFAQDMQELNITTDDSEEVEVNLGVDTTDLMRGIRKKKREFGYYYQEYKLFIISILALIVIFLGYKLYQVLDDKFRVYHENDVVGLLNYVSVEETYYSTIDNKFYIAVKIDISRNVNLKQEKLNIGNMLLSINKKTYTPDKNVCHTFSSLGNCYKNQYIGGNSASYLLTYKVDEVNAKKTYLLYNESFDKSYKIKLDMKNYEG